MKASAIFTFILLSFFTYAQEQINGTWLLPDQNDETPVGIDFKEDGEFAMFNTHQSPMIAYSVVNGYYHFEEGTNTLVTITWEGDEIVTSRYELKFQNNHMILTGTYPNKISYTFSRPRESSIGVTKI